jgi:heme/copper-type cytochrome/quinol oxidase subunit 3
MNLVRPADHAPRIAMWSVIASEAVLFAALLAMRGGPRTVPSLPSLATAAAIAIALITGSRALGTATRRMRDGQRVAACRLLVASVVLGIAALALELGSARLYGARDPAGMVLVGLHAAHVSAAIALSTWSLGLVQCGHVDRHNPAVLSVVRSFWYFVAILWIFVWPLFTAPRS